MDKIALKYQEEYLDTIRREEMVRKRKESRNIRFDLLRAYQEKEISLKQLKDELMVYYESRVIVNRLCLTVSFKLPPTALVYMDLEVVLRKEFINRSEMLRVIIREYMDRYSERFVHDLLSNTD